MKLFVTGIGTEVGKTLVSAILTEALEADYWKPVQAGDLDFSDTHKVKGLLSNSKSVLHNPAIELHTPASPHKAADLQGIKISKSEITEPKTKNHLIIEGAGGLLVPLNEEECIIDLIKEEYKVVVVSRHYLGSINHTLLTVEALRHRGFTIAGIVFNGEEDTYTESVILSKTGLMMIGRVGPEPYFDRNVIRDYADRFQDYLKELL